MHFVWYSYHFVQSSRTYNQREMSTTTLLQENYFCYGSQTQHYPSEQRVQDLKPTADKVKEKLLIEMNHSGCNVQLKILTIL